MYMFRLSIKNILRNKRRTVITFAMLSFGTALYVFLAGMFAGFDVTALDSVINFESGDVKVRSKNYDDERVYALDALVDNPQNIMPKIKKFAFVKGVTTRLTFFGEMDNGIDSTPVVAVAVNQETDESVFSLKKYYIEGDLQPNAAVVGKELAEEMGLSIGDYFFLTFRTKTDAYYSLELWVSGLLLSPDATSNKSKIFMNLDEAQQVLGVGQAVREINIKTNNVHKATEYAKQMRGEITSADVLSWRETSYALADTLEQKGKIVDVILFFVLLIAMIGIINTILISIYEKRREIGTLKALGMLDKEVRNLFISEGFLLGLVGSLLGVALGALINWYFVVHGFDFGSLNSGSSSGMAFIGVVKSQWSLQAILIPVVLSTLVSTLAAYLPARKVMKMQPVETLRVVQ